MRPLSDFYSAGHNFESCRAYTSVRVSPLPSLGHLALPCVRNLDRGGFSRVQMLWRPERGPSAEANSRKPVTARPVTSPTRAGLLQGPRHVASSVFLRAPDTPRRA